MTIGCGRDFTIFNSTPRCGSPLHGKLFLCDTCKIKQQREVMLEAYNFLNEMMTFGGKYQYLAGTPIISDARTLLKRIVEVK